MRKLFVALIATLIIGGGSANAVDRAAPGEQPAHFIAASLAAPHLMPAAELAIDRTVIVAPAAPANWAAILATNSLRPIERNIDARRLHRVRTYVHILWSPGASLWSPATAATQRTRAVRT